MESLTGAYYGAEVHVEQYQQNRVRLSSSAFERISDALDASEPILVKLEETYFPIYRGERLPRQTMALPANESEPLRLTPPDIGYIWIPKNQERIQRYYGQ